MPTIRPISDLRNKFAEISASTSRRASSRVVKQVKAGVEGFAEVVRRNIGRHPDGDTGAAVYQQMRQAGGQDDGLLLAAVVVWCEIDGFFFNIG